MSTTQAPFKNLLVFKVTSSSNASIVGELVAAYTRDEAIQKFKDRFRLKRFPAKTVVEQIGVGVKQ